MSGNDPSLEDLVAEYVDRCESGERLTPEAFVESHPESGAALLDALRRLGEVDDLLPAEPPGLPEKIGPYVIRGELGRGGMGLVLDVAHEERPGEPLALKVLSLPSLVDSRAVERFRREGRTLERFRHPNVVEVLEVGSAAGAPYIAMSRVEGHSLAARMARARHRSNDLRPFVDRLELEGAGDGFHRAAAIAAPLARAVAAAHAHDILHRDIKPGNVVLCPDGSPVLLDFGLASAADATTLTRTGDVIGTPQYMAPEQARGRRAGPRADVYGLGTVLFEMVSGRPPHMGTDSLDVLERVRREPAVRLRKVTPAAPRDLETILMRALAFEPENRYADADAFAADLEAFVAGRPIAARRPSALESAASLVRRHRRAVAAGVVMLVLAAAAAAAWVGDDPPPPPPADPFRAAVTAWIDGDAERALEEARVLAERSPGDERVAYLVARLEERPHEPAGDPVVRFLVSGDATVRRHAPSALRAYGNAVAAEPTSPLAAAITALAALDGGAYELAEHELGRARALLPDSTRLAGAVEELARKRADLMARVPELRAAVAADPGDADAVAELATTLYRAGDAAAAVTTARGASAALGGEAGRVLLALGYLFDLDLQHSAAQEIYREVLQDDPDDLQARYALAFSLDIEHKARAAVEQLEELVRREPRKMRPLVMLANIYSGANRDVCGVCRELYEQHPELLDPDRTVAYCEKLIALDDRGQHALLAAQFASRLGAGDRLRGALQARVDEYARKSGSRAVRRKKRFERALEQLDARTGD